MKSYTSQVKLFEIVWKRWGRLDVLIANAGSIDGGSHYNFSRRHAAVDDLPTEPDTSCTDIDVKGTIYGTTLATHFMRNNPHGPGGKIIITGSMVGVYPCHTFPEHCAAKAATHQWVRTMGPVLQQREGITINAVMPGGIETAAMPGFSKAFRPEQMTLRSTLISAYDTFLNDASNSKSGQLIESAHEKLIEWPLPEYKSGAFAKRTEAVFEPWFELMHRERSGIPGTLPDWPDQSFKIIAVTGATGCQGGGVVNVMKRTPGWKVRAITRRPDSDAARKLAAEGIDVVQADYGDEASLLRAFEASFQVIDNCAWLTLIDAGRSCSLCSYSMVGTPLQRQDSRRSWTHRGRARDEHCPSRRRHTYDRELHLVNHTQCKAFAKGPTRCTAHGPQSQCRRSDQIGVTASGRVDLVSLPGVLPAKYGILPTLQACSIRTLQFMRKSCSKTSTNTVS